MKIGTTRLVVGALVTVFAASIVTAPMSTAAKGTANGRAACGDGYKLLKAVSKKASNDKNSKKMVVEVYKRGNTLCAVTVKKVDKGKKKSTATIIVTYKGKSTTQSGKYKYYAGPIKKSIKLGQCIMVQGGYGSDVTDIFKACNLNT